jgi:hypothetical protein
MAAITFLSTKSYQATEAPWMFVKVFVFISQYSNNSSHKEFIKDALLLRAPSNPFLFLAQATPVLIVFHKPLGANISR